MLSGYDAWAVDCGGDLRIGGDAGLVRDVEVEHPFTGETLATIQVTRRRGRHVRPALAHLASRGRAVRHHLLDPATGAPAFTGLVAVTALAPSTVEAEASQRPRCSAAPRRAVRSRGTAASPSPRTAPSRASVAWRPHRVCASVFPHTRPTTSGAPHDRPEPPRLRLVAGVPARRASSPSSPSPSR